MCPRSKACTLISKPPGFAPQINALNAWTMSVVACKSFHADVHAGNLLVLESGKVAFIDFGIVGTISPKTWQAVEGLAKGLAEQVSEQS